MDKSGHNSADPSEPTGIVLPPVQESVRTARHYVQQRCREAHFPPRQCAEAGLLTGEIVANAVCHAGTATRVRVRTERDYLMVEVADGDTTADVAPVRPTTRGGRGLRIVEAIATSWGVRRCAPGKTVWFQLSLP
jgi:anti-sigma regulatory factor (Ser/Thr protein kinase)